MVALEQRRDAATVGWARRNMEDQLPVPERLVVDRQRRLVIAKLLKGPHDAASQPVVVPMRIQDACSLLTAQDLHLRNVDPGRCEITGEGGDLRLLTQQAHHAVGGPVIEVIDVDLGFVHVLLRVEAYVIRRRWMRGYRLGGSHRSPAPSSWPRSRSISCMDRSPHDLRRPPGLCRPRRDTPHRVRARSPIRRTATYRAPSPWPPRHPSADTQAALVASRA